MTEISNKRWTLSEIKAANEAAGFFFFSRDTMRFFGDTMRSFGVNHKHGKVYVKRLLPMRRDGRNLGGVGERRLFDPVTGDIGGILKGDAE